MKTVQASMLRNHLADVLEAVSKKERFLVVTKQSKPVSAIVNLEFFEDLLAATSPTYLKSIREAREDYAKNRVFTHHEVFGHL